MHIIKEKGRVGDVVWGVILLLLDFCDLRPEFLLVMGRGFGLFGSRILV